MDNTIFTGNRYETWKFELLTLSGNNYVHGGWITEYIEADESNISIDFSRKVIGNCKLKFKNSLDIDYLSDRIKIYYALSGYEFPLGVYMPLTPRRQLTTDISVDVFGYGLLKALDGNSIQESLTIASGTVITDYVETILDTIGTWIQYSIEPSTETLPEDKTYVVGTSKLFIVNSLLNMINYYPIWVSGNGVFRAIPWSETKNITYTFQDNNQCIYLPDVMENKDYAGFFNRVLVIANELNTGANLYKSWSMEDEGIETHPFSYTNIGRYEDKILYSEASSQDYVDLRARREIRKAMENEETLTYSHGFVTSRENDGLPYQGDYYKFINTELAKSETYKIEKMDWQLGIDYDVKSVIRRVTEP